jgi:hypothetical protein
VIAPGIVFLPHEVALFTLDNVTATIATRASRIAALAAIESVQPSNYSPSALLVIVPKCSLAEYSAVQPCVPLLLQIASQTSPMTPTLCLSSLSRTLRLF